MDSQQKEARLMQTNVPKECDIAIQQLLFDSITIDSLQFTDHYIAFFKSVHRGCCAVQFGRMTLYPWTRKMSISIAVFNDDK